MSIGLAMAFLIAALFVFFNLTSGELKVIDETRSTLASKSNALENQTSVVEKVQALLNKFKSVEKLRDTVSRALPPGENSIEMLRQLEAITTASRVELASVGFQNITIPAPKAVRGRTVTPSIVKRTGTLEFSVSVKGIYEDLKQFLQFLEANVRVSNVKSFAFVPASGRETEDTLNIIVDVYYQE